MKSTSSSSLPPIYGTNPPLIETYNNSSYLELIQLTWSILKDIWGPKSQWIAPDMITLLGNNPNFVLDISACLLGALLLTIIRLRLGNVFMKNVNIF